MSPQQPNSSNLSLDLVLPVLQRESLVLNCSDSFSPPPTKATIFTDSRKLGPGGIFLAYKGVSSDGHRNISAAIEKGAALIIVEEESKLPSACKVPWIAVSSGRFAWSFLAAESFGNPQNDLKILAITGTNGKTSTAWMIHSMLKASGVPSLLIGTLGAWVGDSFRKTSHTTPDPDLLFSLFAEAKAAGIKFAVMEAASQSLLHGKLAPIKFSAAAFTSFSRDHLDLHGTMENYFEAKWSLFTNNLLKDARVAISDGVPVGNRLSSLNTTDTWIYRCVNSNSPATGLIGLNPEYRNSRTCEVLGSNPNCTSLTLRDTFSSAPEKQRNKAAFIPYFGAFFIENFVAATLLVEHALNASLDPSSWKDLPPVPGRLEKVDRPSGNQTLPHVLVDYAHTPDALEKALSAVRELTKGKLIVVFGCGGDRDRGKRPEMAAAAFALADFSFITSDNPRTEDPQQITDDIIRGAKSTNFRVVTERKTAIEEALAFAGLGDVVLIAGKGHEDYQIIGTTAYPFDDRLVAKNAMVQLNVIKPGKSGI